MTEHGPPGRVYVENDWYDGPRAGVADIDGAPCRFFSAGDEDLGDFPDTFQVWPIDDRELQLEIEQWQIFVAWNLRYESGRTGADTHPGHGGIDARWDEIEELLRSARSKVPPSARRARAVFHRLESNVRYAPLGPNYWMSWSFA